MTPDLFLLLVGAGIGFLSSVLTIVFSFILEGRRLRRQWHRDDQVRREDEAREDQLRREQREHELALRNEERRQEEQARAGDFLQTARQAEIKQMKTPVKSQRWFCLAMGTQISLADGSTKPIQEIKKGDILYSYDIATQQPQHAPVINVSSDSSYHFILVNKTLKMTPLHMVYTTRGFHPAGDLQIADTLLGKSGDVIGVETIEWIAEHGPCYNLNLDEDAPYFAEGILVAGLDAKQAAIEGNEDARRSST
jgi:hypothetical protein